MQLTHIILSIFAVTAAAADLSSSKKSSKKRRHGNCLNYCPTGNNYFGQPLVNTVCPCGRLTKLILEQVNNTSDALAKCATLNTRFGGNWVLATVPAIVPQALEQQKILKKCLGCESLAQVWLADNMYYFNNHWTGSWVAAEAGQTPVNRFVMCQVSDYPQVYCNPCGYN